MRCGTSELREGGENDGGKGGGEGGFKHFQPSWLLGIGCVNTLTCSVEELGWPLSHAGEHARHFCLCMRILTNNSLIPYIVYSFPHYNSMPKFVPTVQVYRQSKPSPALLRLVHSGRDVCALWCGAACIDVLRLV